MKISRWALGTMVFGYVLVQGLGCGNSDTDGNPGAAAGAAGEDDKEDPAIEDVLYETGVTDEALESVIGVTAKADDTHGSLLTAPADGAVVPAATPFTFSWAASTASLSPDTVLRGIHPRALPAPHVSWPSWLSGEGVAHAHGAPFTGTLYFVVFSTPSNPKLVRLASNKTSYTPPDDVWKTLTGAKETITVSLTAARIEANLLADGGGPFTTTKSVSFTIQ